MSDPVVLLSTGDVVGPAGGVTDNSMVLFSGTSGKLIKGNNAVVTAAGLAILDDVDALSQRSTLGLVKQTSPLDVTSGSIMVNGAFGLGSAAMQMIANADTLSATGLYATGTTWTGSILAGTNNENQGTLVHMSWDSLYATQHFRQIQSNMQKTRHKNNGVWGSWVFTSIGGQAVVDANDALFPGSYQLVAPHTNGPVSGVNCTLQVGVHGSSFTQVAVTFDVNSRIFYRPSNIGVWGAWVEATPIGHGQTWQTVTGSRVANTTYTNTSTRPRLVQVLTYHVAAGGTGLSVNGVLTAHESASIGGGPNVNLRSTLSALVPVGGTYIVQALPGFTIGTIEMWREL